jgi:hypothetical protein
LLSGYLPRAPPPSHKTKIKNKKKKNEEILGLAKKSTTFTQNKKTIKN